MMLKIHLTSLAMTLANYSMEMSALMAEFGDFSTITPKHYRKPNLQNSPYYTIKEEGVLTFL